MVDRQHPHDLFMELAARVDINVGNDARLFVYGGPVGEPAIGPSAFMHRSSARYNPEAPITHHWFDSTHITYGVATLGYATPAIQFEGSVFTGREPDEKRWNIESPRFDSWSLRGTWTPSPTWTLQASHARLKEPEAQHPGEDEHRTTASVSYANGRGLSATAAYSAKNRDPGDTLTAWLPMVYRLGRANVFRSFGTTCALTAAYFLADAVLTDMGARGALNPIVAAWAAHVVFGALGIVLMSSVGT